MTTFSRLRKRIHDWRRRPAHEKPSRKRVWLISTLAIAGFVGFFFWLTSARILGEAIEINDSVDSPSFAASLGPLLGAEFTEGNRVELLVNGDVFFPAMIKAISEAKQTVSLETYIWRSGKISDQFIAALTERARAGVKVRVLGDGRGMKNLVSKDRARLREGGVELLIYGREKWYQVKPNINHRTHRKLLVIDGLVGFTGGMCVDDLWSGNAESVKVWRDTQVRIEGPAARQMQAVFATNWLQTTGRILFGANYFPADAPATKRDGEKDDAINARVQCYQSGPNEGPEHARISYLAAIAAAKHSIIIANAYFVPDDLSVEMLLKARARGVRVQVLAPGVNDSSLGRAASRSRWGKLLAAGVEFHLYQQAMYHSKMMIVDNTFTTLGSTNFDNRSFSINDEVNVNILDTETVIRSREIFENDIKGSKPMTLAEFDDRGWWVKMFDHMCGAFRSQI